MKIVKILAVVGAVAGLGYFISKKCKKKTAKK